MEGLSRAVLQYCDGVLLARVTLKSGESYWSAHFDANKHPVDSSVQFVYIVYGQILDRTHPPHIFRGKYKAHSSFIKDRG